MTDIQNKSQEELLALIAEAQTQLEAIKRSHYKEVIAKIKELAASIGVTVDIHETSKAWAFSATAHCCLATQRLRQDVQTAVARQYDY
jgi:DNA-binding protein H-NS